MPKGRVRAAGVETRTFQGKVYTQTTKGHWRTTIPKHARTYLHRDLWEAAHGPIPEDHDIHHIDEDKGNNDLSNLECLKHEHHTHRHKGYKCL